MSPDLAARARRLAARRARQLVLVRRAQSGPEPAPPRAAQPGRAAPRR